MVLSQLREEVKRRKGRKEKPDSNLAAGPRIVYNATLQKRHAPTGTLAADCGTEALV